MALSKGAGEGVGQAAVVQEGLGVIPPGHALLLGVVDQNLVKGKVERNQ